MFLETGKRRIGVVKNKITISGVTQGKIGRRVEEKEGRQDVVSLCVKQNKTCSKIE